MVAGLARDRAVVRGGAQAPALPSQESAASHLFPTPLFPYFLSQPPRPPHLLYVDRHGVLVPLEWLDQDVVPYSSEVRHGWQGSLPFPLVFPSLPVHISLCFLKHPLGCTHLIEPPSCPLMRRSKQRIRRLVEGSMTCPPSLLSVFSRPRTTHPAVPNVGPHPVSLIALTDLPPLDCGRSIYVHGLAVATRCSPASASPRPHPPALLPPLSLLNDRILWMIVR